MAITQTELNRAFENDTARGIGTVIKDIDQRYASTEVRGGGYVVNGYGNTVVTSSTNHHRVRLKQQAQL